MASQPDVAGEEIVKVQISDDHRARARWIARHVLPHEAELRRALRRRAPPGFEIDDIVQEIYARLAGLASIDHIRSARSYLFSMAGGIVLDHVRHQKVVSIRSVDDIDAVGSLSLEPSPEAVVIDRDEMKRFERVLAALPPRIGEVFRLRRVEGLAQREVAKRLGISESTVEKQMARGVYLIARGFEDGGNDGPDTTKHARWNLGRGDGPGRR